MSDRIKKPGYMFRAVIAWCIFNAILLFTLAITVYIIQPFLGAWYVMVPLLIAVVVSEWIIMSQTIAPIINDWINQEEYVKSGEKPSWERDK